MPLWLISLSFFFSFLVWLSRGSSHIQRPHNEKPKSKPSSVNNRLKHSTSTNRFVYILIVQILKLAHVKERKWLNSSNLDPEKIFNEEDRGYYKHWINALTRKTEKTYKDNLKRQEARHKNPFWSSLVYLTRLDFDDESGSSPDQHFLKVPDCMVILSNLIVLHGSDFSESNEYQYGIVLRRFVIIWVIISILKIKTKRKLHNNSREN